MLHLVKYCQCCADHFRHEHYLCNHQLCLDRKFIVFMTEQELKQHAAREHGGNMSKAERRQALTIPINFQVCLHEHMIYTPPVRQSLMPHACRPRLAMIG